MQTKLKVRKEVESWHKRDAIFNEIQALTKGQVAEVKIPLKSIFKELVKYGLVQGNFGEEHACDLHPNKGHLLQDCEEFKRVLQALMDNQLVQIGCWKEGGTVSASKEDKKRILAEKREKRQARLESRGIDDRRVPLCHISKSFRSAGFEFQEAMAITEETNPWEGSQVKLVRVCPSGTELENWDTVDLPMTFISALK